jgi:hypothetical protein
MPRRGGLHQRRMPILVMVFDIRSMRQQDIDSVNVTISTGVHQRSVASRRLGVDVGPVTQQQVHYVDMTCRGGLHQWRTVVLLAPILHLSLHRQQHLSQFEIARRTGQRQQRVPVVGGVVQRVAVAQQSLDGVHIVVGAGGFQGAGQEAANTVS